MAQTADAFVIDASVAVKWHLRDEENVREASVLLDRFARGDVALAAPRSFRYEVSAAFTRAVRSRAPRLTQEQGRLAITSVLSLAIMTLDADSLILDSYELSNRYGCTLYDALYLATAQSLSLPFVTADRPLYELVRQHVQILWIGSYS